MSSIDNRIVQMQFENSQFERGVSESLKTLDALKKSLDLKDSGKSLSELQKLGDSFSLAKMANGIEQVTQKFSMLGIIGRRIFENLADDAYRAGKRFIASVSTDQITKGWQKYADKTSAVQTIMAATGEDIGEINKQLDKLNWFTDETSYNFVDMINNIGKFTSMGIDLGTSVTAMQGIATWAAVSGAGIQGASRAMYNLSQAIGTGSVKLIDWKSIENANMATKEFKETVIETAKAMGVLTKEGKTKKGTLVTFENFSQTLSKGWFNKDVLLKSLQKYGEYADAVYQVASEKGISAAEAMELVSGETMELGEKAFKAAQEAKTFSEAIDSVKDAVSTGWMNMFENVFGNYEEAKKLWTDLANYLWDIFASPLADTNEILAQWKELGGREKLLKGIYDIFSALKDIITAVGAALGEIFPPITVERLMSLSDAVAEFGANLKSTFGIASYSFDTYHRKHDAILDMYKEENFQLDDRSEKVKEFQRMLVDAGVLEEKFANGIFNPATAAAFEKYQKGLDGIKEKLETTLKFGDKGKEVEEFQKKLAELGFDPGAIDGIWGKKTQAAFERYEASLDTVGEKYRELKRGQKGEDVKRLQEALIVSGKLDEGQADGIFGPKTEKALREYQKAQGITETGILDEETIKALYGEDVQSDIEKTTRTVETYSDTLERLKNIAKGVFSVFRIGLTIFSFIGNVVETVLKQFAPLGDALITILSGFGIALGDLSNGLANSEKLQNFLKNLNTWLEPINKWAQKAADGLLSFFGFGEKADGANKSTITFYSIWEKVKKSVEKTGIIKKVAKAWEDLKAVFETIKKPLEDVWNSIKQWFSDRFTSFAEGLPDTIGNIASSIGDFIANVFGKIAEWIPKIPGYIEDIKAFFGAFFSPGDEKTGEKQGFGNKVWEFIKSIPGKIADFIQKVPGYAKKIGGVIKELWDSLKLSEKFQSLGPGLTSAWETVKEFFTKLWDAIKSFFNADTSDTESFGDKIKKKLGGFTDLGEWISGKWASLLEKLGTSWEGITSFFDTLWGIVKKFAKWVIIGLILYKVIKLIGSITGTFKKLKEVIGSFKQNQQALSKSIMQFAIAIGIIALSIWLIAQLDPDQLKQGLIVVGGIIGAIVLLNVLSAIFMRGDSTKRIKNLGNALKSFAIGLAVLVGVIVILSFIPYKRLIDGMTKLAGIMVVVLAFIALLNIAMIGRNEMKFKGLIGLAVAIGIIALVVGMIGKWKTETIIKGLIGLMGIVTLLSALMIIMGIFDRGQIKLKGLISLSIAIGFLAVIVGVLGKMNSGNLLKGIAALTAISAILAVLMVVMGTFGRGIKARSALGLLGLAAVIAAFALSLRHIEDVDTDKLLSFSEALTKIMLAFSALTFASRIGHGNALGSFKNIIAIAGALAIVIAAFSLLTKIPGFQSFMENGASSIGRILGKITKEIMFSQFQAFADGIKLLNDAAKDTSIDKDKLNNIIEAARIFVDFVTKDVPEYPDLTKILALLGGKTDLELLAGDMVAFEMGLTHLQGAVARFEWSPKQQEKYEEAKKVFNDFSEFVSGVNAKNNYTELQTLITWVQTPISLTAGDMGTFCDGVINFSTEINKFTWPNINDDKFEKARNIFIQFGEFSKRLKGVTDYSEIQELVPWIQTPISLTAGDMDSFCDGVINFSTEINKFTWPNINDDKFEKARNIFIQFGEFSKRLKGVTDYSEIDKLVPWVQTPISLTAEDMGKFCDGVIKFSTEINKFAWPDTNDDKFGKAEKVFVTFAAFGKAVADNFNYHNDWEQVIPWMQSVVALTALDMETFGNRLSTFAATISDMKFDPFFVTKSNLLIVAAKEVAKFMNDLATLDEFKNIEKYTEEKNFLGNVESQSSWYTVAQALEEFGKGISYFNALTKDFNTLDGEMPKNITNAIQMLKDFTSFLVLLGNDKIKISSIYESENYSNFLESMDDIKETIVSFNDATKGIDLISISMVVNSFTELMRLLSGQGSVKISTDNFLGDLDANAVVKKLTSFTNSLTTSLSGSTEAITSQAQSFNDAGSALTNAVSAGMSSTSVNTSALELSVKTSAETIKGYAKDFAESGRYLSAGLAVGITFNSFLAVQAARLMAQKVIDNVRKMFDQASPSKVFAEIGRYNDEGLANGMTQYSGVVTKAAEGVGQATIDTARSSLASLSSILAEDIDDTPVVRPIVDLTNAREAASSIGGMFHNQSFGVETANLASRASAANAARVAANQNGSRSSSESSVNSTNSAVNLTGNNFYVRSEQDIESLASEIATLNKQQQRSMGAAF